MIAMEMQGGTLLHARVEDVYGRLYEEQPKLLFTSPPFGEGPRYAAKLQVWFERLAQAMHEHGSIVVSWGNAWTPPGASPLPFRHLELVDKVVGQYGFDLMQTFVLDYGPWPRMSPSVARSMQGRPRALDTHAHAWWWARSDVGAFWREVDKSVIDARPGLYDAAYEAKLEDEGLTDYHATIPVAVPAFFVRVLTNPGELVLDPFAGTNSTGFAAAAQGRRWLSVEADATMVKRARCRPM
jgi:hypothetical protein